MLNIGNTSDIYTIPSLEDDGCALIASATEDTLVTDILDADTFDNGCAASGNIEATAVGVLDTGIVLTVVVSAESLRASIISV